MFNPSLDAYSSSNRTAAMQNFVGGQVALVSPAGLLPHTTAGLKPADKVEKTQSVENKRPAEVSRAELDAAVKKINAFVLPSVQAVEFSVDQESERIIVKVVDTETKAVLRQIPNEDILAISKALDKLQGLIIRQEA